MPSASICSVPKPSSARTEPSAEAETCWNFTGFNSTPLLVACLISAAMNFCWRCIRPRSEPTSTWRERTYWSAWPPSSSCEPAGRFRPVYESFIGRAVQIFTPPTASTVFMKLVKSTSR